MKLYIAAPFFNDDQLRLVGATERLLDRLEIEYYSPRHDGVLKDMGPEERAEAGPRLFALNLKMISDCDAVLALKTYKDTGTTWECGYAVGIGAPVFGYSGKKDPLNLMVVLGFTTMVYGWENLEPFLRALKAGDEPLSEYKPKPDERIY